MTNKKLLSPLHNAFLFNALIKLSGAAKISFILGSQAIFFSAAAVISPLSGAFAGLSGSFAVLGFGLFVRLLAEGFLPLYALAYHYHLAGFFASLYWATQSKFLKVIPAVVCMILFIAHPTGSSAALYSLFWLIPVICTFFVTETLFTRALGSTFTAHAIGSVIWLYTVPLAADSWLMLIPIVIVERLLFASAMVLMYKGIAWALTRLPLSSMNPLTIKN